ncbi:MAG: 1-acyl-sn-glycerol-3-phosphate acyltransferase [Proteobacteria bacterium]|nr:1-acyl-sn-glycerol-3-phosphate acyltransferase [Pseudomonadota bacterium]
MFKDFLRNPFTILYAIGITMFVSAWTILELAFRKIPRKILDNRLRWWAKKLIKFIKLSYRVHNPHHTSLEKGKAYIVMCNHCSHFDIPLSLLSLPGSIRMLAKKELLQIPVWGKAMRMTDFVSIDRFNPRQALKDMKYAKQVMEKGTVLWIAPEGTRSVSGDLQPFKPGGFRLAIECGATIIPLGIIGSNKVMAAKSFIVNKNGEVDIHIGKPIDASNYNKRQRDQLMQEVESEIRRLVAANVAPPN